jgi:hypothetical protein
MNKPQLDILIEWQVTDLVREIQDACYLNQDSEAMLANAKALCDLVEVYEVSAPRVIDLLQQRGEASYRVTAAIVLDWMAEDDAHQARWDGLYR